MKCIKCGVDITDEKCGNCGFNFTTQHFVLLDGRETGIAVLNHYYRTQFLKTGETAQLKLRVSELEQQLKDALQTIEELKKNRHVTVAETGTRSPIRQGSYISPDDLEREKSDELRRALGNGNSGGATLQTDLYRIEMVYLRPANSPNSGRKYEYYWNGFDLLDSNWEITANRKVAAAVPAVENGKKQMPLIGEYAMDSNIGFGRKPHLWDGSSDGWIKVLEQYINNQTPKGSGYVYTYTTKEGKKGASPDYWLAYMMCRSRFGFSKPERRKVYFNGDGTWREED